MGGKANGGRVSRLILWTPARLPLCELQLPTLSGTDQFARINSQGSGEPSQDRDARGNRSAFDRAEITRAQPRAVRQSLLGQVSCVARATSCPRLPGTGAADPAPLGRSRRLGRQHRVRAARHRGGVYPAGVQR
jgi:hypothetical protein